MKKDDYGFYGSGLDGYVHYRQGMAEAARNAPSSHSYGSYDSSDSDYDSDTDLTDSFSSAPAYSRLAAPVKPAAQAAPEKPEGAKLPPPVTPAPRPAAQQKEENSLAAVGKWLRDKWNAAWVISLIACCIVSKLMDIAFTQGVLYAARIVVVAVIVTSVVELVRAIGYLSKF